MKHSNEESKVHLEKITEGLGRIFGFDGEITPYFWEIAEKGELTGDRILLEDKIWGSPSLQPVSLNKYLDWLTTEQYGRFGGLDRNSIDYFVEDFGSILSEFQIYMAYYVDEIFHIYLGKVNDNWFGLCQGFDGLSERIRYPNIYKRTSDKFLTADTTVGFETLVNYLLDASAKGSFLMSRDLSSSHRDYMYDMAETQTLMIEKVLTSSGFLTRFEFDSFANLQDSIHVMASDVELLEEFELTKKYKDVEQYLYEELTDTQVFIIGPPSNSVFHIYVLGKDKDNDWAGILIETGFMS